MHLEAAKQKGRRTHKKRKYRSESESVQTIESRCAEWTFSTRGAIQFRIMWNSSIRTCVYINNRQSVIVSMDTHTLKMYSCFHVDGLGAGHANINLTADPICLLHA